QAIATHFGHLLSQVPGHNHLDAPIRYPHLARRTRAGDEIGASSEGRSLRSRHGCQVHPGADAGCDTDRGCSEVEGVRGGEGEPDQAGEKDGARPDSPRGQLRYQERRIGRGDGVEGVRGSPEADLSQQVQLEYEGQTRGCRQSDPLHHYSLYLRQVSDTPVLIPVNVVADERERASGVPEELSKLNVRVYFSKLSVGDYVLSPEVAVERKSIPDLISSVYDSRIFIQASRIASAYAKPYLLIEGDSKEVER